MKEKELSQKLFKNSCSNIINFSKFNMVLELIGRVSHYLYSCVPNSINSVEREDILKENRSG